MKNERVRSLSFFFFFFLIKLQRLRDITRMHRHKDKRIVNQFRGLLTALDECLEQEPPAPALNVKSVRSWKYSTKSMKCPQCSEWSGQLADCQMKCISGISLSIWPVCRIYVRMLSSYCFTYYIYMYTLCRYTYIRSSILFG